MGACQSTKDTSHTLHKRKIGTLDYNKENFPPNEKAIRTTSTDETRRRTKSQTAREGKIALNNDVFIARNDVNPEQLYKKVCLLGKGAFGDVWKVTNRQIGKEFAMKIIQKRTKKQAEERQIMNEIKILKSLDHPNIVKILDFYSTSSQYYIVTDYCPLGELFNEIKKVERFDEGHASFIMNQLFRAISYCHGMNVIHRDLKPENIMIVNREPNKCLQVKIIDFGTAKIFEKGQSENRYVGSSYYIAPEVIHRKYNEKCDLWSCGVILYILLTGRPPFDGDTDEQILKAVQSGKYNTTTAPYPTLSREVRDLISKLLEYDSNKRISASEALAHKWFQTAKCKEKDKANNITPINAKRMIDNLKRYHSDNILRCTVLAYLVHHNTNIEQCNEASKLFNKIDVNGDGKIEKNELIDGLAVYWRLPRNEMEREVDIIFENIDTDHNGYIEYEEFVRAAVNQEYFLTDKYLKFAFKYFDRDNSGDISLEEIQRRFMQNTKNAKDPRVEAEIKKIFDEIDLDHNGTVSYDEFCQMMRNIISDKR